MALIVGVINQKGGVGKTATTCNLATHLAVKENVKTLVIDLDPSRNLTKALLKNYKYHIGDVLRSVNFSIEKAVYQAVVDDEPIKNLHIIPSSLTIVLPVDGRIPYKIDSLKRQLLKIKDDYDLIMIDPPPTLGDFTIVCILASDFFIIPIKYESDAIEGMEDLFRVTKKAKEIEYFEYYVLRNCYNPSKGVMDKWTKEQLEEFVDNGLVFETIINQDEEINKAKTAKRPVLFYSPNSRASVEYNALAKEFRKIIYAQ